MKTVIKIINANGDISGYCEYSNGYDSKYNLVSCAMNLLGLNNLWDEKQRAETEKRIVTCGHHHFFEFKDKVYITRIDNKTNKQTLNK